MKLHIHLDNSLRSLPAAGMFVLVAADHVRNPALLKSLECHGCRIMIPGERLPALVREALPALEGKDLGAKVKGPAMDKEHVVVHPFHGHAIEEGEER